MRIDIVNVEFEASNGERVGLFKPPYHLFGMEGIGDLEAEHQTATSTLSGQRYFGSRIQPRVLSLSIKLKPNKNNSIHKLRQRLSRVCNPVLKTGTLWVTVKDGDEHVTFHLFCVADGYPKFIENKNTGGEMIGMVNFVAHDPMWRSETINEKPLFEPKFRFPFNKKFQMGISRDVRDIVNDGDEPTGVVIEFVGYAENPVLINQTTGEFIKINRIIESDERLVVNTNQRTKSVTIFKDGITEPEDAYEFIDLGSTFFLLELGSNVIAYTAENQFQSAITNITFNRLHSSI